MVAGVDDDGAAVMLVPFMLALASKSDALPLCALGAVQRMISHNAVADGATVTGCTFANQNISILILSSIPGQNNFEIHRPSV